MENYKNKLRKGKGGFPTRCVGCLLALLLIFNSFSAYALDFTNDSYPIDMSDVPSFSNLFIRSKQLYHSVWLCYSPTNETYYYISWKSPALVDENVIPQFIYNNDNNNQQFNRFVFWANWNSTPIGEYPSTAFVYTYTVNHVGWEEASISYFADNYGQNCQYYQLPSDTVLLACDMNPTYTDEDTEDEIFIYYGNFVCSSWGNTSLANLSTFSIPISTKFYFNSSGEIIVNGSPGSPDGEVTNSGLKGWFAKLKLWLQNLGNSISNAIGNIQGWLSSLGSTIGGFFSDLWNNHLSGAFSNVVNWIKAPFQEGDIIYNLWNGLKDFFIDVGDWFLEIPDNIKALFIPDEDFFTDYKADVEEAMELHFGAVYQTVELSQDLLESVTDLFDYEAVEDVQLFFPRIRLDLVRLGLPHPNGRYITFVDTETFYLSEYMPDLYEPITYQFLNNYSLKFYPLETWYAFVTATLFLYLIYYLKNQLNRVLSGSFNIGDE